MCWRLSGDLQGVWGCAGKSVTREGYRNAQSNSSTSAAGIELLKIEKESKRGRSWFVSKIHKASNIELKMTIQKIM